MKSDTIVIDDFNIGDDGTPTITLKMMVPVKYIRFNLKIENEQVPDSYMSVAIDNNGCGRDLADGQWYHTCGEYDQGMIMPVLCEECGGTFKLKG